MKTVLPIPEQDGYRITLPERVRLSAGTMIQSTPDGLAMTRNDTALRIALPPRAQHALAQSLHGGGSGLATSGLAQAWRHLLEKLAAAGMLADAAQPAYPQAETSNLRVPALNAITAILDKIHEETVACFPAGCALDRFIAGKADHSAVIQWLTENYQYTKSARYHVLPVLGHAMDAAERGLWQRFVSGHGVCT